MHYFKGEFGYIDAVVFSGSVEVVRQADRFAEPDMDIAIGFTQFSDRLPEPREAL